MGCETEYIGDRKDARECQCYCTRTQLHVSHQNTASRSSYHPSTFPDIRKTQSAGTVLITPIATLGGDSHMVRIRRTQQRQRSRCPVCFRFFSDVLGHLNHRQSKCSAWFEATPSPGDTPFYHSQETEGPHSHGPPSPPLRDRRSLSPTPPTSPRVSFPGAGKTYGRAPTFLDRFNKDKYAPFRTINMYYPFSSEDEWELASFLLLSSLSMQKVDEFLKLKLVGQS